MTDLRRAEEAVLEAAWRFIEAGQKAMGADALPGKEYWALNAALSALRASQEEKPTRYWCSSCESHRTDDEVSKPVSIYCVECDNEVTLAEVTLAAPTPPAEEAKARHIHDEACEAVFCPDPVAKQPCGECGGGGRRIDKVSQSEGLVESPCPSCAPSTKEGA